MSGCEGCERKLYSKTPLLFNVEKDPSEGLPLNPNGEAVVGDREAAEALRRIEQAYQQEKATFVPGRIIPEPDATGEGEGKYGVCCDRAKDCDCNGKPSDSGERLVV